MFFPFHVPETPIESENLFNEPKKQYFRRPYRLVIIYYGIDNVEHLHRSTLLVRRREDGKRCPAGMPMIHERRKAMFRCVFFCFVVLCFSVSTRTNERYTSLTRLLVYDAEDLVF